MDYALIEDGVVVNLIWLYPGNVDEFPGAVVCGDLPVKIGDTYENGVFYRNGEKLLSNFEHAQHENSDMQAALELLGVSIDG